MKKLQFFSFALAFLLVAILVTASTFTVTVETPLGGGNPGEELTGSFKVTNSIGTDTTVTYDLPTLTGPGGDITTDISGTLTVPASDFTTEDFTITVPQMQSGDYLGDLTVTEQGNSSNEESVQFALTINSIKSFAVSTDKIEIFGAEGDTTNDKSITLENTGTEDLTMSFSVDDLTTLEDSDGDKITLYFPNIGGLAVGASESGDIYAEIEEGMEVGTYTATINIESGVIGVTDSFTVEVDVRPQFCPLEADNLILEIDIENPEDEDNVSPGDDINIEVLIDNKESKDKDVVVKACLYDNDGKKVECEESEEKEVEGNDDKTFDFDLNIPIDDSDMDEGTYILYVYAYEDGHKDEICTESTKVIELDFERESHMIVAKSIQILPQVANPGDTVTFIVDLLNIGTNDEDDVYVLIKDTEQLGISVSSEWYELKEYDDEGDNDAVARVSVTLPEDIENGDHRFEVIVYFDGTDFKGYVETVTVTGAEEQITVADDEEDETLSDEQDTASEVTGAVTFYPTSRISSWIGEGTQSTIFWIIGDLVLVIVAIYFVTLIFRNRK